MLSLLSQVVVHAGPWSIGEILIAIIVIAACVGITMVVLRVFGVSPPEWIIHILWIVLAACIAIFAIRIVLGM